MIEFKEDVKKIIELLEEIEEHLKKMAKEEDMQEPKPQENPTQKKKFVENMRVGVEAFNKGIGKMFGVDEEKK